jgi:arylsulfatase A-like enzyme
MKMKYFSRLTSINITSVAISMGILTGLVEGPALLVFQKYRLLQGQITFLGSSVEVLWISVFFDAILFLIVGVGLNLLSIVFKPAMVKRTSMLAFCFLMFFSWFNVVFSGRISIYATLILSAGVAFQVSNLLYQRWAVIARLVKKVFRFAVILAFGLFFGIQGNVWMKEEIALRNLPPANPKSPNVLVIVVDALRADHLSSYGYERDTDPNLARLAQEGILFENAYSTSSWTIPSHASLFTGRWPHEHGVDVNPAGLYIIRMGDKYPTVGEVLQHYGYRTAAFSGNFEILNKLSGLGRGFIHFEDYYQSFSNILVSSVYGRLFEYYGLHRVFGVQYRIDRRLAEDINQSVVRWINNSDHPFFVFINYFDVHAPYIPPQPFRSQFSKINNPGGIINTDWDTDHIYVPMTSEQLQGEIDAYDGGMVYIDFHIHNLLTRLKAQGKLENTLVIITSDHGELFGEHGLLEHGNSLYRPVIHVPLIMWWPGHIPQGTSIDLPVSNASLPATILDLIDSPEETRFPVPSLVKIWADPAKPSEWPYPIAEVAKVPWTPPENLTASGNMRSVVSSEWQYIVHEKFGDELYNWLDDPQEMNNLAGDPSVITPLDVFKRYLKELVGEPIFKKQ